MKISIGRLRVSICDDLRGVLSGVIFMMSVSAHAVDGRFLLSSSGHEVIDTSTGLVWRRCIEGQIWTGFSCGGVISRYSWGNALNLAKNQSFSTGYSWRLPNVKELESLVDRTRRYPSIQTTVFTGSESGYFWTSTPYANDASLAWYVDFGIGRVGVERNNLSFMVRLVRDIQ